VNPRTCVILKNVEDFSASLVELPLFRILFKADSAHCTILCLVIRLLVLLEHHQLSVSLGDDSFPMPELEDDISELSSIFSYPGSPVSASHQISLPDQSDVSHINSDDENPVVAYSIRSSPSRITSPLPTQPPKRKQSTTRSWVWGKAEDPLGLPVEILGIRYSHKRLHHKWYFLIKANKRKILAVSAMCSTLPAGTWNKESWAALNFSSWNLRRYSLPQ
jgi:hypothetical protein